MLLKHVQGLLKQLCLPVIQLLVFRLFENLQPSYGPLLALHGIPQGKDGGGCGKVITGYVTNHAMHGAKPHDRIHDCNGQKDSYQGKTGDQFLNQVQSHYSGTQHVIGTCRN